MLVKSYYIKSNLNKYHDNTCSCITQWVFHIGDLPCSLFLYALTLVMSIEAINSFCKTQPIPQIFRISENYPRFLPCNTYSTSTRSFESWTPPLGVMVCRTYHLFLLPCKEYWIYCLQRECTSIWWINILEMV